MALSVPIFNGSWAGIVMMLMAGKRRRESHVATRLTSYLVAITAKQRRKMTAGEIARQFQARITSSLTM